MPRGPKKHLKRVNAPKHWMLDKMAGTFVRPIAPGVPTRDAAARRGPPLSAPPPLTGAVLLPCRPRARPPARTSFASACRSWSSSVTA